MSIEQDALLTIEDKRAYKAWVTRVLGDGTADDFAKRAAQRTSSCAATAPLTLPKA